MIDAAILDVAAGCGPLEITVEPYAVRWIDVDALDLTTKTLAFGQARHCIERIAEDHTIRPILIVLVELGLVDAMREPIEVSKQVEHDLAGFVATLTRLAQQIVDERF